MGRSTLRLWTAHEVSNIRQPLTSNAYYMPTFGARFSFDEAASSGDINHPAANQSVSLAIVWQLYIV